jgi:enoyl-CoA hydratase/carnithine racemase
MTDIILAEDHDRVRVLSINRPDALNAMNNAVFQGIAEQLAEAQESSQTAVVVITGVGKAFCAGQDLEEFQVLAHGGSAEHEFPKMLKQLTNFKKPLIAAVNGLGVGIGMTMLAHCDLVLMAKDARLKTPFPQLGLAPEAGSSSTFIERMGWQNAAYTLLSGRWFNAMECLDMGLVWRLEESVELMQNTLAVATELAANPIPSLVATKELMLASGRSHGAWAAHEREAKVYEELLGAPANSEALAAFVEKREANFSALPGI